MVFIIRKSMFLYFCKGSIYLLHLMKTCCNILRFVNLFKYIYINDYPLGTYFRIIKIIFLFESWVFQCCNSC
ncbi:hypothetical protein HanRHA438_Chr11g0509781 [Helianthus annuus]|nr:hypothetical protein HanRHA438_Chr11g0509781 [Helianthus annuus]